MGNVFCRSKRIVNKALFDIEKEIYMEGCLKYLDYVGMDQDGVIKKDNMHATKNRSKVNLEKIFNQYCEEFLDLENVKDFKDFDGTL